MSRPVIEIARGAWGSLVDLLYPPSCFICGASPGPGGDFCAACLRDLPGRGLRACPRCARPIGPGLTPGSTCAGCAGKGIGVDGVVAAAAYRGPVRELIHRFKFRGERSLGRPLGRWITEALAREGLAVDVATPVPLHWWREFTRGYNQSEILCEEVSRGIGVPIEWLLARKRATRPQIRMGGARERAVNVRGAFRCRSGRCRGRAVLLVDDVLSTGATMAQCALVLRGAGAARVVGAVIAR